MPAVDVHSLDMLAFVEHGRELRKKLSALQWCREGRCPECRGFHPEHRDDCELDALLQVKIENVPEVRLALRRLEAEGLLDDAD